jgi:hypothetical protein
LDDGELLKDEPVRMLSTAKGSDLHPPQDTPLEPLKRILQSKLDQARWNHGLRDLAEVGQIAAEVRVCRDRKYGMIEKIEEVRSE